jgi:hypothetical protein
MDVCFIKIVTPADDRRTLLELWGARMALRSQLIHGISLPKVI